ncbi:hypothetical protein LCGC14_0953040 [marine sediment metagenome]|uniref:SPOR domain-containing protein n=1 Tax=marine sediment metagenome TaxID=412755 RepID=A0A0F9P2S9_9ZZZZ|nr:SPOR domain-containing protein [Candidatus Aminicenantes bacterium]
MNTRKKIMIGGLGALTPVIMNLLIVDLNVVFVKITLLASLAYVIRIVILFSLGGFVAFLHKGENSPIKIFELGIVAPALITAMINAGQVPILKAPPQTAETSAASFSFIPSVYALPPQEEEIKTFSLPKESSMQQIWRGLTGSSFKRVWFVIVGSHPELEDARNQAHQIDQRGEDFEAEVYAPYDDNPNYSVVIGANLTYEEAKELKKRAIEAGLPKDTHLWTFPKKK